MYRKRLLAMLITVFAFGVVFAIFLREYDTVLFRALFTVLATASVLLLLCSNYFNGNTLPKRIIAVAFAVAAFSFGVLRVSFTNVSYNKGSAYHNKHDEAIIEITDVNINYLDAKLVKSSADVPKGTGIRFYPENMPEYIVVGDELEISVSYINKEDLNLFSKGIALTATGEVLNRYEGSGLFYAIRKSVSDNSEKLFSGFEHASEISKAVVVGDKSGLDSYLYNVYKAGGMSHVLAISGLHISLISFTINRFLILIRFGYKKSVAVTVIVAILYTVLVGFSAGTVRACALIVFSQVSLVFFKRMDSITALFIALLILLMINPYAIFSVGLQLSFLSSFGIILINPMFDDFIAYFEEKRYEARKTRVKRWFYNKIIALISPVFVSFSATVFSFPIICTRFDTTTAIAPLVNFILLPLFSFAVVIALIAFIIAPVSISFASIIAFPAGVLFDLITSANESLLQRNIGIISAKNPFIIIPVVISFVIIFVMIFMKKRVRETIFWWSSAAFCVSLALCCLFGDVFNADKAMFVYSSAGAEYAYFRVKESNTYIDLGGYTSSSDVVFDYYDTELDKYVVINYDEYTFNSFKTMSGRVGIKEIHLPIAKNVYELNIYSQIKELANERKCDIITYDLFYMDKITDSIDLIAILPGDTIEGNLICADIYGKRIRLIGDGYSGALNCDVAILSEQYSSEIPRIISAEKYVSNAFVNCYGAPKNCNAYEETIVVEIDIVESDINIYEP